MSSLLVALQTAGSALRGIEKAMGVTQSNIANASTPGYARKQIQLLADPYNPAAGEYGGLETGNIESARNNYAEQSVWNETTLEGYYDEQTHSLTPLQSVFDVSSATGIAGSLNRLFEAFSAWSQRPNDQTARQNVITAAGQMATGFQQTYLQLSSDGQSMVTQMQSQVEKINSLVADIAKANHSMLEGHGSGTGDDAGLYSDLEQLSELANVSYVPAGDGSFTVLLAGQTPLVMASTAYPISLQTVPAGGSLAPAHVTDSAGNDVTGVLTGGRLGAELTAYNTALASLLGDGTVPGSLNDLASALVTQINTILQSGQVDDPTPPATPTAGGPLFSVVAGMPAAESIALASTATAANLAAIDPNPTISSNGIPLRLAALATAVNGSLNMSFSQYFAHVGSDLGNRISSAKTSKTRQDQLLSQAKSLRGQISGVSLNEEAAQLMAFQQSYQATARVFTTVNTMLETLMSIVR